MKITFNLIRLLLKVNYRTEILMVLTKLPMTCESHHFLCWHWFPTWIISECRTYNGGLQITAILWDRNISWSCDRFLTALTQKSNPCLMSNVLYWSQTLDWPYLNLGKTSYSCLRKSSNVWFCKNDWLVIILCLSWRTGRNREVDITLRPENEQPGLDVLTIAEL
jgi:hypothetical protein